MNSYKNENSLKKNLCNIDVKTSKNISLFSLKFIHKIFDSINVSLLILIFLLSFISFNSQRKWTYTYINLAKTREKNNNLVDYISKTEESYIDLIESLKTLKKTSPKDLIYLGKQSNNPKKNNFNEKLKYIYEGLRDSAYQIGY